MIGCDPPLRSHWFLSVVGLVRGLGSQSWRTENAFCPLIYKKRKTSRGRTWQHTCAFGPLLSKKRKPTKERTWQYIPRLTTIWTIGWYQESRLLVYVSQILMNFQWGLGWLMKIFLRTERTRKDLRDGLRISYFCMAWQRVGKLKSRPWVTGFDELANRNTSEPATNFNILSCSRIYSTFPNFKYIRSRCSRGGQIINRNQCSTSCPIVTDGNALNSCELECPHTDREHGRTSVSMALPARLIYHAVSTSYRIKQRPP